MSMFYVFPHTCMVTLQGGQRFASVLTRHVRAVMGHLPYNPAQDLRVVVVVIGIEAPQAGQHTRASSYTAADVRVGLEGLFGQVFPTLSGFKPALVPSSGDAVTVMYCSRRSLASDNMAMPSGSFATIATGSMIPEPLAER